MGQPLEDQLAEFMADEEWQTLTLSDGFSISNMTPEEGLNRIATTLGIKRIAKDITPPAPLTYAKMIDADEAEDAEMEYA